MTNRKKFKQGVRERMKRTGEAYMTAARNLEAASATTQDTGATTHSAAPLGANPHQKSRECFRSNSIREWKILTNSISGGVHRVEWTDPCQIIAVLNRIGNEARDNHVHLPTSGGFDLQGAKISAEAGCIEVSVVAGSSPYITRPVRLVLNLMKNDPLGEWSFFWYETATLAPSGVYKNLDPRYGEELLELSPRHSLERGYWDAGHYELDDEGRERPLPDSARVVRRHLFGGPFLMVAKGSSWNASPTLGDYLGGHAKQSESEFAEFLQTGVDDLQRSNLYGIDPGR